MLTKDLWEYPNKQQFHLIFKVKSVYLTVGSLVIVNTLMWYLLTILFTYLDSPLLLSQNSTYIIHNNFFVDSVTSQIRFCSPGAIREMCNISRVSLFEFLKLSGRSSGISSAPATGRAAAQRPPPTTHPTLYPHPPDTQPSDPLDCIVITPSD